MRRTFRVAVVLGTAFLIGVVVLAWPLLRPRPSLGVAAVLGPVRCLPGSRPGPTGRSDDIRTPQGLPVSVRTPRNYDPARAQPLMVVYPPAGFGRSAAEQYYGLTEEATQRGWIVAYPAPVPLSQRALAIQQEVAATVAERWCIAAERVAFVGHSDGASVAEGLLLRSPGLSPYPKFVLASAAGLRGIDLAAEACPRPLDLTLVHSVGDERFPDYGRQAARWWAACFACQGRLPPSDQMPNDRCVDLGPCAAGGHVRYCEADEDHASWPRVAAHPFRFFSASAVKLVHATLSTTSRRS